MPILTDVFVHSAPPEMDRLVTEDVLIPRHPPKQRLSDEKDQINEDEDEDEAAIEEILDQEPFFLTQVYKSEVLLLQVVHWSVFLQVDEQNQPEKEAETAREGYSSGQQLSKTSRGLKALPTRLDSRYKILYQISEDEEKYSLNLPKG